MTIRTEIKWAFIFAIIQLAWMALEKVTGLHDQHIDKHPIFTNFFALLAVAIYVLALLDKRKTAHHGYMTYGQGVVSGLILTLFITILTPLTQYITSSIISPDYFENAAAYAIESQKMTQEEANKYFNLSSYVKQGLIGTSIMGVITTLIVAIFTRKKRPAEQVP